MVGQQDNDTERNQEPISEQLSNLIFATSLDPLPESVHFLLETITFVLQSPLVATLFFELADGSGHVLALLLIPSPQL